MLWEWLAGTALCLVPAAVLLFVSGRNRVQLTALCRGLLTRAQCLAGGSWQRQVCVTSTHAFVFSRCTHGKARSVLETFDLYAKTNPSLSLGPETGMCLDEVMRRVSPRKVLELGMHCGYSSIRMLRLLPPAGRLVTVEVDPRTADKGEELILVAGFKYSQFQVLVCSSAEAIPALRPHLGGENEKEEEEDGSGQGLELVLMDHDPEQYLPDLLALEREDLLSPAGCCLLLVNRWGRRPSGALRSLLEHLVARPESYSVRGRIQEDLLEVQYRSDRESI
ncbi:transmembrane O-methyltransferase homolog [Aplochiton taeniatus]